MSWNGSGWMNRGSKKPRTGKMPWEKEAPISLQSLRGENDSVHSSDCRSEGFDGFDIKPWTAVSSLDNWDEQSVAPNGLADGDYQKCDYPSIPWEEKLACDIFGNILETKFVSRSGHVNFYEIDDIEENNKDREEEIFREYFYNENCECWQCMLAEEWVKQFELIAIQKEIEIQYHEVYYTGAFVEKSFKVTPSFVENGNSHFRTYDVENWKERVTKRRSRRKKTTPCKWNHGRKNATISDMRGCGTDINQTMQANIERSIAKDEEFRKTFI